VADVLADCEAQLKANARLKDYSRIPRSEPQRPGPRPRLRIGRWATAAAVLLLLLGGLGITEATGVTDVRGTVIRLFSPEGTLVVEVADPGVSIKIDESDLVITGAGAKEIRLKPGRYTVEARKDGKLVSRELVTVTKNGKQVVRVSQEAATVPKTAAEKKDPDRRAAEYVLSMRVAVRINDTEPWVRGVAELPQGPFRLTYVNLRHNKQVTDADLAAFAGCTNVTYLNLSGTQVTDGGLAQFKDCKGLTELRLEFVRVTDAGLAVFKNCNLTAFHLGNTPVTDVGLAHLKDCKNLTVCHLLNTRVTDAGLAHLKDCKNLTWLDLRGTYVTDAGLAYFKDCKNLSTLWLADTSITDAGLALFKDCKNLTQLALDGTQVTDAGLADLAGLDKLTDLNLANTKVTAKGVEGLAKALPKCKITWNGGVIEPRVGFAPLSDADVKRIAALPAAEQVEEVRKELKRRNPDFDGTLTPTIENDVVTGLKFSTDHVSDISPVRALTGLRSLGCSGSDFDGGQLSARALLPLRGLPLTNLRCLYSPAVSDLSPLKEMKLTSLDCRHTNVGDADVKNLAGQKDLQLLSLWGTKVTDVGLKELAGLKNLQQLSLQNTKVTDVGLKELAGLDRLVYLDLYAVPGVTDAGLEELARLKALKHLELRGTSVTDAGAMKLASVLPSLRIVAPRGRVIEPRVSFAPFPDADVKRIAALPAAEQVEEVRKELKRRNPDFDGTLTPTIENDVVTGLAFSTEQVSDVSPVRALTKLKNLKCAGGKLIDLSPLEGLKLATLDLSGTQVSDLSPLKGMPLSSLDLGVSQVRDLSPLKGMPLTSLILNGTPVVDLSPLKGMPLTTLHLSYTKVRDLSPLEGLPLTALYFHDSYEVRDLSNNWREFGGRQDTPR